LKQPPPIFTGILCVFAVSFAVLAMAPALQLGSLQPQVDEDTGDIYPIDTSGVGAQGRAVYVSQGCVSCHTEQVLPPSEGADIARGWGVRRTVARDYIYDKPVMLGYIRLGPDLANIGVRKDPDNPDRYSVAWHYLHLYNPQAMIPGSIMPSYKFLFERRKIVGQEDADALKLTGDKAPPPGYQIVPGDAARELVGYLTSLDHSHPLKEAGPNIEPPAAKTTGTGGPAK
jgi:cytochrome c oxidase cbb3-type subunit II